MPLLPNPTLITCYCVAYTTATTCGHLGVSNVNEEKRAFPVHVHIQQRHREWLLMHFGFCSYCLFFFVLFVCLFVCFFVVVFFFLFLFFF